MDRKKRERLTAIRCPSRNEKIFAPSQKPKKDRVLTSRFPGSRTGSRSQFDSGASKIGHFKLVVNGLILYVFLIACKHTNSFSEIKYKLSNAKNGLGLDSGG